MVKVFKVGALAVGSATGFLTSSRFFDDEASVISIIPSTDAGLTLEFMFATMPATLETLPVSDHSELFAKICGVKWLTDHRREIIS